MLHLIETQELDNLTPLFHYPDFFPTPPHLAKYMVEMAQITAGDIVLEPSAGNGAIATYIQQVGAIPHCVEVVPLLQEILRSKGLQVVGSDILNYRCRSYRHIVANPPFSRVISHIIHCYHLLTPGGILVSIVPQSLWQRHTSMFVEFRHWLKQVNANCEALPNGSFLASARPTAVKTCLIRIEKPKL